MTAKAAVLIERVKPPRIFSGLIEKQKAYSIPDPCIEIPFIKKISRAKI